MFPRREWLFLLLIGLVTALAIGGGLFYFYKPRNLSIAVGGPSGNDDFQLVAGIARRLVSESAPVRFRTIAVATPRERAAEVEPAVAAREPFAAGRALKHPARRRRYRHSASGPRVGR